MSIYQYESAFGACDKTSRPMRKAIAEWFALYYGQRENEEQDPCQKIAYTVVNKLVRTVFGEYAITTENPLVKEWIDRLDACRKEAVQLALVGGECYIKPWIGQNGFVFVLIPRNNILIFGKDAQGNPTDIGTVERCTKGKYYYFTGYSYAKVSFYIADASDNVIYNGALEPSSYTLIRSP